MKSFVGRLAVAVLAFGFIGCGGGGIEEGAAKQTTPDGRPAGFEDMMKGMNKEMTSKTPPKPSPAPTK